MLPKWRVDAALGKVEPYKKYPFLLLLLGCKHRARDSWRDIESKSP